MRKFDAKNFLHNFRNYNMMQIVQSGKVTQSSKYLFLCTLSFKLQNKEH